MIDKSQHYACIPINDYIKWEAYMTAPTTDSKEPYGEVIKYRTKVRSKELGLYEPTQKGDKIIIGSMSISVDEIATMDDDPWEAMINEVNKGFGVLDIEELPKVTEPELLIDHIPAFFHIAEIEFNTEKPFIEVNVSKSVFRFYHKDFDEEAEKIDLKKFKIVDRGVVGDTLQFILYGIRPE